MPALNSMAQSQDRSLEKYDIDQTTGFRMQRYRAPVPDDIPGAETISNNQALKLHQQKAAIFLDVYPPRGLGPDPLDGHWIISEERYTIPGSIWLPEVGRGSLEADALEYYSRNLDRLSGGDKNTQFVIFCTADCWQSWNASRRATQLGYTRVHWYPLGTDGWLETDNDLVKAMPVNFIDDTIPESTETVPSR